MNYIINKISLGCIILLLSITFTKNSYAKKPVNVNLTENIKSNNVEDTEEKIQKLKCELELKQIQLEKDLNDLKSKITKIRLEKEAAILEWEYEFDKERIEHEKKMLNIRKQTEELKAETDLMNANIEKINSNVKLATQELENKLKLINIESDKLNAELKKIELQKNRGKYANKLPSYTNQPLNKEDRILTISDRKIEFYGIINTWKADYVVDKINYFNNKDNKAPIFIIIESSPGGSSLAGERILRAMESSKAPVYVVIKGFAASMAAIITTLAEKSYIYKDAAMLHHQPQSYGIRGSLRTIKEEYILIEEMWKRLGGKLAKKMGISLKEFDKQLYNNSATGDWMLYGDQAMKLKWVDEVINGIEDTSILENPVEENYDGNKYLKNYFWGASSSKNGIEFRTDSNNNKKVILPKLNYPDFYFMVDPYNQYYIE